MGSAMIRIVILAAWGDNDNDIPNTNYLAEFDFVSVDRVMGAEIGAGVVKSIARF
jgi:hypothetical protein